MQDEVVFTKDLRKRRTRSKKERHSKHRKQNKTHDVGACAKQHGSLTDMGATLCGRQPDQRGADPSLLGFSVTLIPHIGKVATIPRN